MTGIVDQVSVLELQPADLVVAQVASDGDRIDTGVRLKRALREHGLDNLVVVLGPGESIAAMNETTMRRYGWQKSVDTATSPL